MLIKAHDAELAQFSLNVDGSRIASASEKGTLIRIWDCFTGDPLRELRRCVRRLAIILTIACLAFTYSLTHSLIAHSLTHSLTHSNSDSN